MVSLVMETKEFKTPHKYIAILPFSDLHIGDNGFTKVAEDTLKANIKWVKDNARAYAILNGDIINCATMESKSSPFQQTGGVDSQIKQAVELFRPIKDKILGAIDGNHEQRLKKYCSYSPTISICDRLGITYMGDSAIYILRLGMGKRGRASRLSPRATFSVYSHHTTGGGALLGSRMNPVVRLRQIISNADCYVGGHNHMLGIIHDVSYCINPTVGKVERVRQIFVDAGSYVEYNNTYAEQKAMSPSQIGSPKIIFEIKLKHVNKGEDKPYVTKDVHASI